MLQTFRDNLKGTVAVILVGLICIPFALFGIDSLFNSRTTGKPVAKINGEEVSEVDLQRAITMRQNQLTRQFGEGLPAQFLDEKQLREPVLKSLVQREVLLQEANSQKLAVSQSSVDQIIVNSSDFQVDGKFDANRYQALLRTAGYTNQGYKSLIADELVLTQFAVGVGQTNFVLPNEINTIASLGLQTRDFNYFTVEQKDFSEGNAPSDEEIQTYYDSNQSQFLKPETVVIEALELNTAQLADQIDVTDEDVESEYQQEKSSFQPETQRRAAHILLDPDAENYSKTLADVQGQLTDGKDFGEVAKHFSTDFGSKDAGGDVGYSTGNSFVPEFEDALAKLSVGEISEPVKTEFGVHIIKLLDEKESSMPTLDEMRLTLVQKIKQARAEELFLDKLNEFKDYTYNVEDLSQAAEQMGLELWVSEPFSRFSGSGLASNPKVIEAAFSEDLINSGHSSDTIELDPQSVVAIRVKEHHPEMVEALDAVKQKVTDAVKAEKAKEKMAVAIKNGLTELAEGKSLAEVAELLSAKVETVNGAKRQQADIDGALLKDVFTLPVPSDEKPVSDSVELSGGKMALVQLVAVHSGEITSVTEQEKKAVGSQLGQVYGEADITNVRQRLVETAKVEY